MLWFLNFVLLVLRIVFWDVDRFDMCIKMKILLILFIVFLLYLVVIFFVGICYENFCYGSLVCNDNVVLVKVEVNSSVVVVIVDEYFFCVILDWWLFEKCDYGICVWGNIFLFNVVKFFYFCLLNFLLFCEYDG